MAAVLAVIGGIVLAVELQSFWYVVYAAIGATLMLLVVFAMAALLDATETNAEMLQTLMQQAAKPESSAPKTIADAAEAIVPPAKAAKRPGSGHKCICAAAAGIKRCVKTGAAALIP